ncbi:MAG: DUF4159 domain-containing protein [Chloroflexota bacterium]
MISEELLQQFPGRRIKPFDGMAVTSEVWEEAHHYHHQQQRLHALFSHGPGIITGLEVLASDPPDTSVYILPGIAVDPSGQTIVLPQPVAYDIGQDLDGLLYILLSYGESRPRAEDENDQADAPKFVHAEFSIFARTSLPASPCVELARVMRQNRDSLFHNPVNWAQPGPNELDLRFRREIGAPPEVTVAVCYLGKAERRNGLGAIYLAHSLNRTGQFRALVEEGVALAPGVEANTLIYLVGQDTFELSPGQMNGLNNYVQRGGGTLFIESSDAAAESVFTNMLKTMGLAVAPLSSGHRLLTDPYLFAAPPPGFETGNSAPVLVGNGVIFSARNYGRLWQGEQREGSPTREQIRAALEWGGNILAYAAHRRRGG